MVWLCAYTLPVKAHDRFLPSGGGRT